MKRLLLAVIVGTLALAGVVGAPDATAEPNVEYRCKPGDINSCATWYRVPVELTWLYNTADSQPFAGDCVNWISRTFTADTKGTNVTCQVWDPNNHFLTDGTGTTLRIDRTAPTITGPGLARPPDYGDWFNHPVGFGFTGADATSGIQSCTGGT